MKRIIVAGLGLAMIATACTTDPTVTLPDRVPPGGGLLAAGALVPFDACDPLLAHLKREALDRVTAWGLPGIDHPGIGFSRDGMAVDDAAAEAPAPAAAGERVDYSGTNVQEVGVDEPDVVKTDGRLLVSVVRQTIRVVDVSGNRPRELSSIRLPDDFGDAQLLLVDDRLAVLGQRWTFWGGGPVPLLQRNDRFAPEFAPQTPVTVVRLLDLADPRHPTLVADLELDGQHLSSRLIGGVAHLVIASQPTGLTFEAAWDGGVRGEGAAKDHNEAVIRRSTIDDWLPGYAHTDGRGVVTEGELLGCTDVSRPEAFAGFGTLSILSLDLTAAELLPTLTTGVLTGGHTVYASPERIFVATTDWVDWASLADDVLVERAGDVTTDIHAFEVSAAASPRYAGSGSVPGTLLNQFSLSEHGGHLRVATTEGNQWWGGPQSQSTVTNLRIGAEGLTPVGSVTGLGKGEQIYAVRFLGDVGYVVTFRQVDPLYVLDLSDPARPTVEGELKIPGYSAYLHPAGDGLLIGVGQDATDEGRVLGLQVSLFDVSDPTNPTQLQKVVLPSANSEAEWDHHAFLHWPQTGTTVIPMQRYGWAEPVPADGPDRPAAPGSNEFFIGAAVFQVGTDAIELAGRVSHARGQEDWEAGIRRSLVIGDVLYTLSDIALVGVDLETLAPRSELTW